jgi:hypothetical protein
VCVGYGEGIKGSKFFLDQPIKGPEYADDEKLNVEAAVFMSILAMDSIQACV